MRARGTAAERRPEFQLHAEPALPKCRVTCWSRGVHTDGRLRRKRTELVSPGQRAATGSTALRREGNHSERWQREFGAERLAVRLILLRHHRAQIAHVAAAINCRVAV